MRQPGIDNRINETLFVFHSLREKLVKAAVGCNVDDKFCIVRVDTVLFARKRVRDLEGWNQLLHITQLCEFIEIVCKSDGYCLYEQANIQRGFTYAAAEPASRIANEKSSASSSR